MDRLRPRQLVLNGWIWIAALPTIHLLLFPLWIAAGKTGAGMLTPITELELLFDLFGGCAAGTICAIGQWTNKSSTILPKGLTLLVAAVLGNLLHYINWAASIGGLNWASSLSSFNEADPETRMIFEAVFWFNIYVLGVFVVVFEIVLRTRKFIDKRNNARG